MASPREITAITATQRSADRATIRVGGRVVATLSTKLIADLDLHVGQPWSEALAARIEEAGEYDKAMRRAMNRLARRAMSRRDLDQKLRDLEFDQPVRERVLDRLTELNYLDDEAYGRALIRDLMLRKPAGPRLLRQKLMQKGIDRAVIDKLVEETEATGDPLEQMLDLARRRLRSMDRLDPAARKRRLWGLLARRGYNSDTIRDAMDALAGEIEGKKKS